ncbi:hypothetical protein XU18_4969 [Perkinsela sp. CCAP 1560/4]|nr:hypothetical protein XU18_4969 [Perkinsela sp. CCAP 1560/4]|eukprot:KNH03699.1 hypothetical protein XU18_4969 [Perkinsela sp. CCAP 1560/4]
MTSPTNKGYARRSGGTLDLESVRKAKWTTLLDKASDRIFLWNEAFHHSVWKKDLFSSNENADLDNGTIWGAFINAQKNSIFQQCSVCCHEINYYQGIICATCGKLAHKLCVGTAENVCRHCSPNHSKYVSIKSSTLRKSFQEVYYRIETLEPEVSNALANNSKSVASDHMTREHAKVAGLKKLVTNFFQRDFYDYCVKPIPQKGNTLGVLATKSIGPLTVVGRYPGYPDVFCAEHCKYGRPIPKYTLNGINCADWSNKVFEEFTQTSTPFINEPGELERANCGWILERLDGQSDNRYSIITIRKIQAKEELLIGYGPSFIRDYGFTYDHFVFLHSNHDEFPDRYDLYHWPCSIAETATFVRSIEYARKEDKYQSVRAV